MFKFFNLKSKIQRFYKIFILNKNIRFLEESIKNISSKDKENYVCKDMDFSKKEIEKRKDIEEKIKKISEKLKRNPEKLLLFIKNQNTKVYRIFYAKQILNFISEEEGFIPPKRGLVALYLNIFVRLFSLKLPVFSLYTKEIIVLSRKSPEFYRVVYYLHNWYSFKMGLPGFEQKALEKFKRTYPYINVSNSISSMSLDDIDEVRNVIRRKMQANIFVLEYAEELKSSKSEQQKFLLNKYH